MHTVDRMHGKGKDRKTTCTCQPIARKEGMVQDRIFKEFRRKGYMWSSCDVT